MSKYFTAKVLSTLGCILLTGSLITMFELSEATADSFVIPNVQSKLANLIEAEQPSVLEVFSIQTDPEVVAFLAEYIVVTQTKDWPEGYRGDFLYDIAVPALLSAHENKIPPSVVMGQAIFESGWGRSRLAVQYNNLFGIKGKGAGTTAVKTFERNSRNRRYRKWARFKVFRDRGHAIAYHGNLLATDRRYQKARENRDDWRKFMDEASHYYASDPNYAKKMGTIVEKYKLYRWDEIIAPYPFDSKEDSKDYSEGAITDEPSTAVSKK